MHFEIYKTQKKQNEKNPTSIEYVCDWKRGKFIDDQSMGQATKMNDLWRFMNANRVNVRSLSVCVFLFVRLSRLHNFYCIPN